MENSKEKRKDFESVNLTLYKWAISYKYINQFLKNSPNPNALLADIFDDNAEKREIASIKFYKYAWEYYPELGPSLMIEVLSEFEHDRVFYKNYRDHTTHIVKTFLLGLYFYDQVEFIRKAIDEIIPFSNDKNADFVKLWTMTALYHDIGYIFENVHIEKHQEEWALFRNKFNEMLTCPLSCVFSKQGITREKERAFIRVNRIYMDRNCCKTVPVLLSGII
mgnify:CR=1 FL=1